MKKYKCPACGKLMKFLTRGDVQYNAFESEHTELLVSCTFECQAIECLGQFTKNYLREEALNISGERGRNDI